MLKKSSLGSWWSASPTRCPRLLWVILRPGRLPTLTRWSSRRRLWELAIKSNSSSVWGEVVIEGSRRRRGKPNWSKCIQNSQGNSQIMHKTGVQALLNTHLSSRLGTAWSLRHLLRCLRSAAHQGGSAGHPCGCSGTCWGGRRSSLHRRGHGPASDLKIKTRSRNRRVNVLHQQHAYLFLKDPSVRCAPNETAQRTLNSSSMEMWCAAELIKDDVWVRGGFSKMDSLWMRKKKKKISFTPRRRLFCWGYLGPNTEGGRAPYSA